MEDQILAKIKANDRSDRELLEALQKRLAKMEPPALMSAFERATGAWRFGTVLRHPKDGVIVMSLGNGTATPISGYAYTDHVPIPIRGKDWVPVPEPDD